MTRSQSLQKITWGIQRCQRCGRWVSRIHAVPGEGSSDAPVLMLGEAPGRIEDETGRPFVGRAGQYLNGVFSKHGLDRKDLYITSILKCYYPRPPRKTEMECCFQWTQRQAEIIQPKMIFVMGKFPARALFKIDRLGTDPIVLEWHSFPCIVTCHPAAAMRFPERDRQFQRDFRRMMKKVYG